jgi:hypothetical protein
LLEYGHFATLSVFVAAFKPKHISVIRESADMNFEENS